MSIKIAKLITGEEIIGDFDQSADTYTIKKPCALQLVPSRSNPEQPMMALIPFAPYVEEHVIEVGGKNIIWIGKPVKELYNQYNNIFGSGIQLAI